MMTERSLTARLFAGPVLAVCVTLAACGGQSEAGDVAGTGEQIQLRFSTILAPDDIPTRAIERFAELVDETTDGEVKIEIFSSGSLFDQNAEQSALLRGDLDMTFAGPQWVADRVPAAEIISTPYVISDADHLYRVMDGPQGLELFDLVREEMGIRPLTTLYIGTRQLNLRDGDREVSTPADLAGLKLRVPDRDNWIYMGRALGADPTPVAFGEVYLALQTGTIDAQETPLPLTYGSKLHEVTEQIVLSSHVTDSVWPTINEDAWQELAPAHQKALEDAWRIARDEATVETLDLEAELAQKFEEAGLRVYEPDIDAFREHVLGIYLQDDTITEKWLPGMYDEIDSLR